MNVHYLVTYYFDQEIVLEDKLWSKSRLSALTESLLATSPNVIFDKVTIETSDEVKDGIRA